MVQMGESAEKAVKEGIQRKLKHVCMSYGESNPIHGDDPNFKKFSANQKVELQTIGKRPDLLLFEENNLPVDFPENYSNYDNKNKKFQSDSEICKIHKKFQKSVPCATLGIEVRSSNFFYEKFKSIPNQDGVITNPWLSITVKLEDLKLVKKWIDTYGVPHYYAQVFEDQVYIISFKKILEILNERRYHVTKAEKTANNNPDGKYRIGYNKANQEKLTLHVKATEGKLLGDGINVKTTAADPDISNQGKVDFILFDCFLMF